MSSGMDEFWRAHRERAAGRNADATSELMIRVRRAYLRNQTGVLAVRREPGDDSYIVRFGGRDHVVLVEGGDVLDVFGLDGVLLRRLATVPNADEFKVIKGLSAMAIALTAAAGAPA